MTTEQQTQMADAVFAAVKTVAAALLTRIQRAEARNVELDQRLQGAVARIAELEQKGSA